MNTKPPLYGDQIQGDRDNQEDTFNVTAFGDDTLLLLCDGMGGHVGGEQASCLAVEEFVRGFSQHSDSPFSQRLDAGLASANAAIKLKVTQSSELKGMGTTLVAVYLSRETMRWISVGDSPLWLLRDDKIQRLNADHSMAGIFEKWVQQGEISLHDAANDPKRHVLYSSVSGEPITHVDLREAPFYLQKGDCVLLASDGLETLSEQDIIRLVSNDDSPEQSVATLLRAVKDCQKPQQDNATAIVYHHRQSLAESAGFTFSTLMLLSLLSLFLITLFVLL